MKYNRISILFLLSLFLSGCSSSTELKSHIAISDGPIACETPMPQTYEPSMEEDRKKPLAIQVDWSDYFEGLNGAAVFFRENDNQYMIYNQELAEIRRSPCSTFKIISSLIGLEKGIIPLENSTRKWSGEMFWNENWNKDIDFKEAFQTSCIWYFREVINELGSESIQNELNKLQYGNCDISDWEGRLNTNNNNRMLTGFWVESSLKISAKEQVEVMKRIFDNQSEYKPETLERLREAMLVTDQNRKDNPIYGKTGLGKKDDIVVDSWFTGFLETSEGNVYFCVYLGRTDGENVSSARAKEIAVLIASDHF